MSEKDDMELVKGSGNVFADFNHPHSEVEQLKAVLAGLIIKTLDNNGFTVRAAQDRTGIAAADFSRIRRLKLDRFTIDRLMTILDRLDGTHKLFVSVSMELRNPVGQLPSAH